MLNTLITTGGILGLSGNDIAQLAVKTGLSTSQIKSIMETTRQGQMKLQTATNDNGDLTIYDALTGKIVNTIKGIGGTKGSSGSGKTPETNKYLSKANSILISADTATTGGDPDKLLSRQEQMDAYNKILALVGGDATLAQEVFQQAWDVGGYNNWGE